MVNVSWNNSMRSIRGDRFGAVGLLLLCVSLSPIVLGGCHAPHRTFQPPQDPATLDDVSFIHYLATVPVATVDEGMRAVLLLTDEHAECSSYQQRFDALHELGAVKTAWKLESDQILNKGTLAFMLRVICDMPGGFNEQFASWVGLADRRYALKTCVGQGVLHYGVAHAPVKGGELLSALTATERYLRSRTPDTP